MIKTILVPTTGSEGDSAAFAAALAVARPFAAHLDMLHVRLDPVVTAAAMTADTAAGPLTAGLVERLEQDAAEREAKARAAYERFRAGAGIAEATAPVAGSAPAASLEWHVETGEEPRWIAAYGTTADLIVTRRATGADDAAARTTLETALLETGRPILIPAAAPLPATFERIAIAWKPTPQSARAVALAMPFLQRAKEISVTTVDEDAAERASAEWLVRNLAWHGFAAKAEPLKPLSAGAAATLLAAIGGRMDLLVMGGYGHSRLRQWIFGGFTQHVLADAPLPVLMAH